MSVTIGSISAALLGRHPFSRTWLLLQLATRVRGAATAAALAGVSGHAHKNWGSDVAARAIFVRVLALIMMALSILMTLYAAYNFRLRGEMLLCAPLCCCATHFMQLNKLCSGSHSSSCCRTMHQRGLPQPALIDTRALQNEDGWAVRQPCAASPSERHHDSGAGHCLWGSCCAICTGLMSSA